MISPTDAPGRRGGPLAGVELPLMPTEHGEPAGFPGSIPELHEQARKDGEAMKFTPQGQFPVRELRDGSPEMWMAYMDKYMPVRSMFDRQSLVRAFRATELDVADGRVESYAAPVMWVARHGDGTPTGRHWSPRDVVRTGVKNPVYELGLGELSIGMYAIKVLGAVEPKAVHHVRKPLYVTVEVNDRPGGGVSRYRHRAGYNAEFYSVAEIYFHIDEQRDYSAKVYVDEGSAVDLLLYNIELHDALTGIDVAAHKTRSTLFTEAERRRLREEWSSDKTGRRAKRQAKLFKMLAGREFSQEERWQRDEALWNAWIPLNTQHGDLGDRRRAKGVKFGAGNLSADELRKKYGQWVHVWPNVHQGMAHNLVPGRVLMVNKKLDLEYTMADLAACRPLPDPYPFKDDGSGLYTAGEAPNEARNWIPIAVAVNERGQSYTRYLNRTAAPAYHYASNETLGRDAAVMLIRLAYDWPTFDQFNRINNKLARAGGFGRDQHARQRETNYVRWPGYPQYHKPIRNYDWLYDLIDGNQDLADSVHRFIPWVQTDDDVLALLDSYLLRHTAKKILRYHWHTGEYKIAMMATVQDAPELTEPWMQWLFTRTWVYPLPPTGLGDLVVSGTGRDGIEFGASSSYGLGENAFQKALALEPYLRMGGNTKYDLSDPQRYPKTVTATYWPLRMYVAGLNFVRVGNVTGPDKGYGYLFDNKHFSAAARSGWKWTEDSRFAYLLAHFFGRVGESEKEWAAIETAAKQVDRAPWLTLPSRSLPQWATILESGREHDDFRFRRTVYVRTGQAWGHHHNDTLDLQMYAHGLPMTTDGGQRPGYSKPGDRSTRMHNVVEVDGFGDDDGQWLGHSWARALSDTRGAQYMRLAAVPPPNHRDVSLYERQVALIDVDEGEGSRKLRPEQLQPGAELPADVVTPNSYVVDIVRVAGGNRHTYSFHASLADQVQTNARRITPFENIEEGGKDRAYLAKMREPRQAGDAPDHFTATWRMKLEQDGPAQGEKEYLKASYRENEPRKFTQLHLLGVKDHRVLRGTQHGRQWGYELPMVFVQKRGPNDEPGIDGDLQSAYAAVIEPYAGEPFITSIDRLTVTDNEDDAQRAVALRVRTVEGHRDLIFADGRPDKVRRIEGDDDITIAAEHAFYSTDEQGLRQAALTGGTRLDTPRLKLQPARSEHTGTVTAVDYARKSLTIDPGDAPWPEQTDSQRLFEVGTGAHWTGYTATAVADAADGKNKITVLRSADAFLSRIRRVDPEQRRVYTTLGLPMRAGSPTRGLTDHWVASNEDATRFWRATYKGSAGNAEYAFTLDGPVSESDFGEDGALRLWEYGVGDQVRQSTAVNLRRIDTNTYMLHGDTEVTLSIQGAHVQRFINENETWQTLDAEAADGWVTVTLAADMLRGGVQLRITE
ncbi:MAG: hypothetical protein ACODAQ_06385 [Phycisphaeraceae bacterium]